MLLLGLKRKLYPCFFNPIGSFDFQDVDRWGLNCFVFIFHMSWPSLNKLKKFFLSSWINLESTWCKEEEGLSKEIINKWLSLLVEKLLFCLNLVSQEFWVCDAYIQSWSWVYWAKSGRILPWYCIGTFCGCILMAI